MDQRRLILFLVFAFSIVMLWEGWVKQQQPAPAASPAAVATTAGEAAAVPRPSAALGGSPVAVPGEQAGPSSAPRVVIDTDLMRAEVSAQGGDIVRLELKKHKQKEDHSKPFLLFDDGSVHTYSAQSGLIGEGLPTHKTLFRLPAREVTLKEGEDSVSVRLEAPEQGGVQATKVLTFRRGSYLVDVAYELRNASGKVLNPHAYFQLTRDGRPAETPEGFGGVQTFIGPAFFTDAAKFQKVSFEDITDGKAKFVKTAPDGWVALVQLYFVSAWLPEAGVEREFFTRALGGNMFSAGVILPVNAIEDGAAGKVSTRLYAGPQEQDKLEAIAPGLDLVVDYGWLTVIAAPLFWVLSWLHKLTGNWGWAIILVTVLLKAAFFPLSAASYKSMAKMRVLGPRLQRLKETYGDDKVKMQQEMMNLYRTEKINPLGGCLPILVQIPVFIALYWVLLGSVEMRQAPWLGWIQDLSTKDPYYVLPVIMGISMFVQTKLNPTPPDPIQAKVMMAMPLIFSVMFLWFPSGLVLYWVVNNVLSIAQQWQITRMIESGSTGSKSA